MPGAGPHFAGVLLAAGSGTRFGGHKLLAHLPDGRTIAASAAHNLIRALPDSVAVLRHGDGVLAALLVSTGLRIVINPNADAGMGSSLACGVTAVEADGWIIALADMPAIRPETMQAIVEALARGAPLAAPVYQGQRGHPIGFARRFQSALIALDGDSGGRDILARHANELRLIEVDDPGVLFDIDHVSDMTVTGR